MDTTVSAMRRWTLRSAGALSLVLLATSSAAAPLWFWPAVRSSAGTASRVAPGIVYSHYQVLTAEGPLSIHHLRVDLRNPRVRLGVGLAHDRLVSEDETVSSMARRLGAVAGVNGDFFDIGDSGMPLNIVVRDGQLLRSPIEWAAFSVRKDGTAWIGRFRWAGALVLPGKGLSFPLAGFNSGFDPQGIVAVSSVLGAGVPPPPRGVPQVVVELAPPPEPAASRLFLPLGSTAPPPGARRSVTYVARRILVQRGVEPPFPPHELLLVGQGQGALWLGRTVTVGTPVEVRLSTVPDWRDLHAALGGGPILVRRGKLVTDPYPPAPNERDRQYPVVAVGLAPDRSLVLVEVDGRQPRFSIGLTQPQLASYMRWLGATDAMAFDSGGSATMVVRFPGQSSPRVVNSPSDGRERPVADALLVFHMPAPRRPTASPRLPEHAPPAGFPRPDPTLPSPPRQGAPDTFLHRALSPETPGRPSPTLDGPDAFTGTFLGTRAGRESAGAVPLRPRRVPGPLGHRTFTRR